MFDRYVSLGSNCEVGFQLKRVMGGQQSSFFNWNVTPGNSLIGLLAGNFEGVMQEKNLSLSRDGFMLCDSSYNYMVHHEFDPVLFKQDPDFQEKFMRLCSKYKYFVDLFHEVSSGQESVAYFYKTDEDDVKNLAINIRNLLYKFHKSSQFKLIILQTKDRYEVDWELQDIHNRYLKRFSPHDDAADGHIQSWDDIFEEFPNNRAMNLVKYFEW